MFDTVKNNDIRHNSRKFDTVDTVYAIFLHLSACRYEQLKSRTRNVCITKYARLYKLSNGKKLYL